MRWLLGNMTEYFAFMRNNTASIRLYDEEGRKRLIHAGQTGSADIFVWFKPTGIMLGLELKRPGGKMSDDQIAWHHHMTAFGVICACADNLRAVVDILKKAYLTALTRVHQEEPAYANELHQACKKLEALYEQRMATKAKREARRRSVPVQRKVQPHAGV